MLYDNTDKIKAELLQLLLNIINEDSGQLSGVARHILAYGAFKAKLGIVFSGAFILFILMLALVYNEGFGGSFGFFYSLSIIISFVVVGANARTLYKINNAPKLYFMEKAYDYIKSCGG